MKTPRLAVLLSASLLSLAPLDSHAANSDYACTSLPAAEPSAEELRAAMASDVDGRLFSLALELRSGSGDYHPDWPRAVALLRHRMDRTSNAPRGSRDWESWDFSARMLVEMYSQGLYGLDVDFDEAARLIELLRSRGADVRDLSARVGALQRGHALVHQGSQLLLDDDPDDALSVFRSATDTGYIRARVIRNALLAFSTDNSLRQEFYDSYYRQLGTSEPHHRVEHFLLGVVQISGTEQVEARTDFALFRFHAAAKLGHARSMFLLGQAFEAGDGVNADYDEARCWYGRAIESFNSEEIVPDYSIGSDARAGLARLSLHE